MDGNPALWSDVAADPEAALTQAAKAGARAATLAAGRAGMPGDLAEALELAAGSHLHDAYTALEQAIERLVVAVDGDRPAGRDSHRQLLDRAARPVEGLRGAVLPDALRQDLYGLLAFRHVFRHKYGGFHYGRAAPNLALAARAIPAAATAIEAFCRKFGIIPSGRPPRFGAPA